MSLLEQLVIKRNGNSLNYYQSLINREQNKTIVDEKVEDPTIISRHHDIKIIDENKKRLNEKRVKTRIEVKRKMEEEQKEEPKKNTHRIQNNTFDSLMAGFDCIFNVFYDDVCNKNLNSG